MRGRQKPANAPPERRLAAILAADIDGYSLLMRDDDDDAHLRVSQELEHLRLAIEQAGGTIFSFAGDGMVAEFASAIVALKCALRIQAASARRMAGVEAAIRFRMAVNAGEILAGNQHIGGAAINLAARLERIAPPGGVALPGQLHDQLRHAVRVQADPVGQPDLHNLAEPVVVVSIARDACLAWAEDARPAAKPASSRPTVDPRAALAIVPFRATDAPEAFASAVTDGVIRSLGGLATWLAVSRVQAVPIHAPIDLHRIRQSSGARYILHGSAETERDMLRLTVELNEAETGRVLWSDRFDHMLGQQATLREDAASRIARAVPPWLLQRELDRSRLAEPDGLSAHDLALRAYAAVMQPQRDRFAAAGALLGQAERRGGSPASRLVRAAWHLMAISQGWSTDPAADAAAAAAAAVGLDRDDPAAMAVVALMPAVLQRDHGLAGSLLDRVIDGAPFCGVAASLKALTLGWLGQDQAAIFLAERAETLPALGPERAWQSYVTAQSHYTAGRYGDAARWAKVSAMQHPGLAANAVVLAASLAVLGRLDEARQAALQVLAIDPEFRIAAWRQRSMLPDERRYRMAQRLRLAGLPS